MIHSTYSKAVKVCLPLLWGGLLGAAFAQPDSLRMAEFKPTLMTDFGHIVKGEYSSEITAYPLNRNTVILEQSATYNSWEFVAGFKGILWFPFTPGGTEPHLRTMRVDPRLSRAEAIWNFGDAAPGYIEFGYFPYKYNPDARNLGEYLYRSGTYPGIVRSTDGFNLMNYAQYDALGVHVHLSQANGLITHNVNIFSEPNIARTGDLTPGYELAVNLPLVQLGMGAAYNRLISYAPSRRQPKRFENGYYRIDSAGVSVYEGPYLTAISSRQTKIANGGDSIHALHYYKQQGVKLMARAAVDLGFLLPEEHRNSADFRIFAEAALLGLEDQPFYYDDKAKRLPIMVGINVPTFKALNVLSLQAEYYGSRFANSKAFNETGLPVWSANSTYKPSDYTQDDWKWSVYAQRSLTRLLRLHVQVANDHLRLPIFDYNISESSLMRNRSDWYYLVRIECGL